MTYLKEFRKSKNLTQEQLADILGFTKSHYVKVEMGIRKPGFNFLKALKDRFGEVDMNEFFK
ncbi:XRE family transcriptional regulator [Lactococcus raffinolactis]|uniref:helix-turn-helix domain-containing protein n=1 Tax=Pseudolactococcus raffinolactis TaxID=1366 RepID=UPI001C70540A|nr:helix-turn-helix transcriptional regulator [Lactococcus raffinolactis]MBW9329754.1 XRE family transcriptional regulator [Lactococcus raffinolactis]